MLKPLSSTAVFSYAEQLGNNKLTKVISDTADVTKGCIYLTEDALTDVFDKLKSRSFPFKARFSIIDMFRNGTLKVIYNPKTKLTVAVPFFGFKKSDGSLGAIVNITNYASLDKEGNVKIDTLTFYALMLGAAYSTIIEDNIGIISNKSMAELYTDLFVSLLNKMINIDAGRKERLKFLFAKFYYMSLGNDERSASNAARLLIKDLDNYALEQIDLAFKPADFATLKTLIDAMRENLTEFATCTYGQIFERFMKSYGESTAFAIEYIPYFAWILICVVCNTNALVNVKTIENAAIKNARDIQQVFDRIENAIHSAVGK